MNLRDLPISAKRGIALRPPSVSLRNPQIVRGAAPAVVWPPAFDGVICFGSDETLLSGNTNGPPRILIVEDDYVVGMELETGLIEAGFCVVGIAHSAKEALRLASAERPILAVMDIRLMGSADGVDAAVEIFRATGIRCIFATAHLEPEMRARAEPAAPLGWLAKPYQLDAIISMINAALTKLTKR